MLDVCEDNIPSLFQIFLLQTFVESGSTCSSSNRHPDVEAGFPDGVTSKDTNLMPKLI